MSAPPAHVRAFRIALVSAVLLVLVVAVFLIPWPDVIATLDPAVDGLRRRMWS